MDQISDNEWLSSVSENQEDMDPVYKKMMSGFKDFKKRVDGEKDDLSDFSQIATEQKPEFMVFACADSRVCPSVVLNFQLGKAFTVRNIGGMVPPHDQREYGPGVGAAIEYGVNHLEVENIVVIGHSHCGGVEKLMFVEDQGTGGQQSDFMKNWIKICSSVREKVKAEDSHTQWEKEAIKVSLNNLKSYPSVRAGLENTLKLIGGYYDFDDVKFEILPHGRC